MQNLVLTYGSRCTENLAVLRRTLLKLQHFKDKSKFWQIMPFCAVFLIFFLKITHVHDVTISYQFICFVKLFSYNWIWRQWNLYMLIQTNFISYFVLYRAFLIIWLPGWKKSIFTICPWIILNIKIQTNQCYFALFFKEIYIFLILCD